MNYILAQQYEETIQRRAAAHYLQKERDQFWRAPGAPSWIIDGLTDLHASLIKKQLPDVPLCMGGPVATLVPAQALSYALTVGLW